MEDCANATEAFDDRESNSTVHEQGDVLKNEAGGDAKATGISKRKPVVPQPHTTTPHKNPPQYLSLLLDEKRGLGSLPNALDFKHLSRLVDEEISKVRVGLGQPPLQSPTQPKGCGDATTPKSGGPRVVLQEKVFVPVHDFPDYNFVGRILGPRGMTAKQLEEETGCRIMIRGRGSTRDEESTSGGPKDELHVLIQCEDSQETAQAKMKHAVECVRLMLKPPPEGEDELKRHQLMQLAIINGTYRPTNNLKLNGSNQSALAQMQMCGYHPNASNNSSIPSGNSNESSFAPMIKNKRVRSVPSRISSVQSVMELSISSPSIHND